MTTGTTSVAVDRRDGTAILRIAGEITGGSEEALMAAYAAGSGDSRAVILDFGGLEYMNSGGIGLLVTLLVRAQRAGVRLLATGLSAHYREILALTRLDEAITILDTETEALAAV